MEKFYNLTVMLTTVIINIVATHIAITNHGGILSDVFSSASKYRINPAEEWNPSPFFSFAITIH